MKLSIVVPIFNESDILEKVLHRLFEVPFPIDVEYILIDDCSADRSWEIIEAFAVKSNVKSFRLKKNQGKGAALRKGLSLADGDIITLHDADFEYNPGDLTRLIQPILDDQADIVYGSRFKRNSPQVHRTFHYLGNRLLTFLSNIFSGLYLSDMETCYKVFRSEILLSLPLYSNRFGFEPEVTAKIAKLNVRVHEYPISYYPRNYGQGKKIGVKDGLAAIWFIIKYNISKLPKTAYSKLPEKYIKAGPHWL